ncbi:MAG: CHAD domain-containing protein [Vicinamibacterales bacterium]
MPRSTVHAAASSIARTLRKSVGRAGGLYEPERLHTVRVAAKKLRYALEVERELTRSRATARITRLKRLQDALGEMHDYEVLLGHVRDVQADVAGRDLRLSAELDKLVRTLEEQCRSGHATFLRQRQALVDLCEASMASATASLAGRAP